MVGMERSIRQSEWSEKQLDFQGVSNYVLGGILTSMQSMNIVLLTWVFLSRSFSLLSTNDINVRSWFGG